jgi:hypothetical protein
MQSVGDQFMQQTPQLLTIASDKGVRWGVDIQEDPTTELAGFQHPADFVDQITDIDVASLVTVRRKR